LQYSPLFAILSQNFQGKGQGGVKEREEMWGLGGWRGVIFKN